jgi:hypothetical protein
MIDQLTLQIEEVRDKREKVHSYIKECFAGVFIHRYRDCRPVIRVMVHQPYPYT